MIEAFAADDVRAAEEPLLVAERSFSGGLMHRAATALAGGVCRELRQRRGRVAGATVVGLVGPGNNGGDTLYALAALAGRGVRPVAVLTSTQVHAEGLAALRAVRGDVRPLEGAAPEDRPASAASALDADRAAALVLEADIALDGMLGLGARGPLREPAAGLVSVLTERLALPGRRPCVLAVDVPSGIGVDDGRLPGPVLAADRTITFGAVKPGLLLPPAAGAAGEVEVVDLGLGPVLDDLGRRPTVRRVEPADVGTLWPVPGRTAHKYSRGVLGVVAGTRTYPGAAVLAVAGALAAGTGMIRYVGPTAVRDLVLAAHPEVVAGVGRVQGWLLGPGLADDPEQSDHARAALAEAREDRLPVVVDAGALELLPDRVGPEVVLTPHAGELARLATAHAGGGEEVTRSQVDDAPLHWARRVHERTGATILLKGAVTVVVGPGVVLSQADAPAWLATAGAGDVLAGVLGAILAGRSDDIAADPSLVPHLVAAAVLVHGRAANAANPGGPITPSDVAAAVPAVVADLLRGGGSGTPATAGR